MNKLYGLLLFCMVLYYFPKNLDAEVSNSNIHKANQLHWVEVYKGKLSTQIMMEFSQPIYFKKKILTDNFQLKLTFPGMEQHQFNAKQVIAKISQLKKHGLINNVYVLSKNNNIPKMILILEFAKDHQISDPNNSSQTKNIPNKLLIKWCKTEDPYRLVIDIFSQEDLDDLKNKNQTILFVKNDFYGSDASTQDRISPKKKDMRIILDPGHGGSDDGTKSFNLKEKDIALSIAKKTKSLLQKNGFKVLLTRSDDRDMSISERSELAEQLKAKLFVSIHVNSDGGKGGLPSGIETFYLDTKEFVTTAKQCGFLYMNMNRDPSVFELIDNHLKDNAQISMQLAQDIQYDLLHQLQSQNLSVCNRGVKSKGFMRVLLRSRIPAALVEVGFITNHNEALRLSSEAYQKNIALGIFSGINKFIKKQS